MALLTTVLVVAAVIFAAQALPPQEREPEHNGLSAFEQNRLSVIEWVTQLLSSQSSETNPPAPDPIDQSKCEPCTCGLTNKMTRIVGGKETKVNQYPWMALLTYNGNFYCGGSLISQRYVLTAAHCVHGFRSTKIRVRLLEHDQKAENESATVERGVKYIVRHPAYNQNSLDHDLALLRLDEDVQWDKNLRPVCLPPLKRSFAGEEGIVTGWGVKTPSKVRRGVSTTLQELTVPIMTNEECKMTGYEKGQITENMLCAGFKDGGKDSCQGDSGGPLHFNNNSFHCIVGVVSWGMGCARPNYPGVYTRVNRYNPWIEKHTRDSCFCQPTRYLKDEPDTQAPIDETTSPSDVKLDEAPQQTAVSKPTLVQPTLSHPLFEDSKPEIASQASAAEPTTPPASESSSSTDQSTSSNPSQSDDSTSKPQSEGDSQSTSASEAAKPAPESFGLVSDVQPTEPEVSSEAAQPAAVANPSPTASSPTSAQPLPEEAEPTPSQRFDLEYLGDLAAIQIFGDDEIP